LQANESHADTLKISRPARPPRALSHPDIKRFQRRHFLFLDLLPFLGTCAIIPLWPYLSVGSVELAVFALFYLAAGMGITVGFHRYFTHRAFDTSPALRSTLAILGSMAGQGPIIAWVAIHRRHHEYSDVDGDPHSPHYSGGKPTGRWRGLFQAQWGWMLNHPLPSPRHYAPDLLADPAIVKISQRYYWCVATGVVLPAVICGLLRWSWTGMLAGLLFGGALRIFVEGQVIASINSICHCFGAHPYSTREHSRNNVWLALPTLGEAWHNNHHAFPTSAMLGLHWWQIDLGGGVVRLLKRFGLIWNVRHAAIDASGKPLAADRPQRLAA
jgi:stearoyl-CoA desaturase (delta-9 desaturase)